MKRLLVILQNPYDKGSLARGFTPGRWRSEYKTSRCAQRLAVLLPVPHYKIHFTNANPRIGVGVDSRHEADMQHIRRTLRRIEPDAVLACGQVAEEAMLSLRKSIDWSLFATLVIVPHPAFRLLHNNTLVAARRLLSDVATYHHPDCYVAFRQRREKRVEVEYIGALARFCKPTSNRIISADVPHLCQRSHGMNRKKPHPTAVAYFRYYTRDGGVAGQWLCDQCRQNLKRDWVR